MSNPKRISEIMPICLAELKLKYEANKTKINNEAKKIEGFVKMEKLNK